jgi:hypothetical protein
MQEQRKRVWEGTLPKTSGGLMKKDLALNRQGKLVSKKKSLACKKGASNLNQWLQPKGALGQKKKATRPKPGKPLKLSLPKKKRLEPMRPGEKKSFNISVGNILKDKRKRKRVSYKE